MKKQLFLWPVISAALFVVILNVCLWRFFAWRPYYLRSVDYLFLRWPLAEREYVEVHFTGEDFKDGVRFGYAQMLMHQIIEQRDTVHGIHFSYGDNCAYIHVIRTMDMLRMERGQSYWPDSDGVWFMEFLYD